MDPSAGRGGADLGHAKHLWPQIGEKQEKRATGQPHAVSPFRNPLSTFPVGRQGFFPSKRSSRTTTRGRHGPGTHRGTETWKPNTQRGNGNTGRDEMFLFPLSVLSIITRPLFCVEDARFWKKLPHYQRSLFVHSSPVYLFHISLPYLGTEYFASSPPSAL